MACVRPQQWAVSEGQKATIANVNAIVDPITRPGGMRGPRVGIPGKYYSNDHYGADVRRLRELAS